MAPQRNLETPLCCCAQGQPQGLPLHDGTLKRRGAPRGRPDWPYTTRRWSVGAPPRGRPDPRIVPRYSSAAGSHSDLAPSIRGRRQRLGQRCGSVKAPCCGEHDQACSDESDCRTIGAPAVGSRIVTPPYRGPIRAGRPFTFHVKQIDSVPTYFTCCHRGFAMQSDRGTGPAHVSTSWMCFDHVGRRPVEPALWNARSTSS